MVQFSHKGGGGGEVVAAAGRQGQLRVCVLTSSSKKRAVFQPAFPPRSGSLSTSSKPTLMHNLNALS